MPRRAPASILVTLLTIAASEAGCNEVSISGVMYTDVYEQSPFDKVDVLLVVDNSQSMGPYQTKLAEDFGGFFDTFRDAEVDWRLAVTHTDAFAFDFGRIRGPVVSPADDDPDGLFSDVVAVGTTGNGLETGLAAAALVLEDRGNDFPRDDAGISVIFVSDEEDASPGPVADYINRYFAIRGPRQRSAFNASALTVSELADCTPEQFSQSAPGTRYVEAARLTGGLSFNLCVDDLSQIVVDLALNTSALRETFPLRALPDTSTLRVLVDDVEQPCDSGRWTYETVREDTLTTARVRFAPDQLPTAGASVVIEYRPGSGDPADVCAEAPPTGADGA